MAINIEFMDWHRQASIVKFMFSYLSICLVSHLMIDWMAECVGRLLLACFSCLFILLPNSCFCSPNYRVPTNGILDKIASPGSIEDSDVHRESRPNGMSASQNGGLLKRRIDGHLFILIRLFTDEMMDTEEPLRS